MQRIACLTFGLTLSALLSASTLQADPPAGLGKIRVLLTCGIRWAAAREPASTPGSP